MSLAGMLAHSVTLVHSAASSDDGYGNPGTTDTPQTGVRARLWQLQTFEATVGRDTAADLWRAAFALGTTIDAGDKVQWDGKTFQVDGSPYTVYDRTSPHHIEVSLRYKGAVT